MPILPPIWVGHAYWNGGIFNQRVLILGESTPGEEPFWVNIWVANSQITQDHAAGNFGNGVFKSLMTDQNAGSPNHVRSFWHSVVFLNYITVQVPTGTRPTAAMWDDHHQPLGDIIESHKPHFVVVVGIDLWNHGVLPSLAARLQVAPFGDQRTATYTSPNDNAIIHLCAIHHPAYQQFSWQVQHARLCAVLENLDTHFDPEVTLPYLNH